MRHITDLDFLHLADLDFRRAHVDRERDEIDCEACDC